MSNHQFKFAIRNRNHYYLLCALCCLAYGTALASPSEPLIQPDPDWQHPTGASTGGVTLPTGPDLPPPGDPDVGAVSIETDASSYGADGSVSTSHSTSSFSLAFPTFDLALDNINGELSNMNINLFGPVSGYTSPKSLDDDLLKVNYDNAFTNSVTDVQSILGGTDGSSSYSFNTISNSDWSEFGGAWEYQAASNLQANFHPQQGGRSVTWRVAGQDVTVAMPSGMYEPASVSVSILDYFVYTFGCVAAVKRIKGFFQSIS